MFTIWYLETGNVESFNSLSQLRSASDYHNFEHMIRHNRKVLHCANRVLEIK